MITIQLIGVIIGFTAIYLTYLYYKRRNFSKKELIFWFIIWFAFVLVAIFPRSLTPLIGYLGLSRSMDLIMIIAFVVIFALAFHNYVINRRMKDQLEKLVRDLSLKDLDK